MKKILVVSPHLDDAVLSCGDLIDKYVKENNTVDVITVFSGKPQKNNVSSAAKKFHDNCFLGIDAMKYRKKEDIKAHKLLKCHSLYLNFKECLYRSDKLGFIYPNLDDIYHLEIDREQENIKELSKRLLAIINNYDEIYAPLGLGNHADHLLVNLAINKIRKQLKGKLFFYEEVAYVCYYYRNNNDSNWGKGLKSKIITLSNDNYSNKISAILLYRSQLNILWSDMSQMISDLDTLSFKYNKCKHSMRIWYYED